MKRFTLIAVALLLVVGLTGAAAKLRNVKYGTVKANQFLLINDDGKPMGGMAIMDGEPTLHLISSTGFTADLSVDDKKATITLTSGDKPRVSIVVVDDFAAIRFIDKNGKEQYRILVDNNDNVIIKGK